MSSKKRSLWRKSAYEKSLPSFRKHLFCFVVIGQQEKCFHFSRNYSTTRAFGIFMPFANYFTNTRNHKRCQLIRTDTSAHNISNMLIPFLILYLTLSADHRSHAAIMRKTSPQNRTTTIADSCKNMKQVLSVTFNDNMLMHS